jgi:formylglycine-generating enzyme required for sulfatase activity
MDGWDANLKGLHWNGLSAVETSHPWTQPYYWDLSGWNAPEQPVVGVSWFEAVAFCLWLSDITSEDVILPTIKQWEYAAKGDNHYDYPWGSWWDGSRCNNSVLPWKSKKTTPVRQYEGKGDSPFGVVDMIGNAWEWCLTDSNRRVENIDEKAMYRMVRGGSWKFTHEAYFKITDNAYYPSVERVSEGGFRLARSL